MTEQKGHESKMEDYGMPYVQLPLMTMSHRCSSDITFPRFEVKKKKISTGYW